jgi:hypothetical protein
MNWTLVQLAVDTSMFTVIWVVQLIVYPSFKLIRSDLFQDWHAGYMRKISFIVGPAMLIQLISHGYEAITYTGIFPIIQTCLILIIWVQTFIVAVPLHQNLSEEPTPEDFTRLVRTNWPRTIGWTFMWMISLFRVFFFIL